jgi:hypothetical protein
LSGIPRAANVPGATPANSPPEYLRVVALQNVALGFHPENVLVMRAAGPGSIRDTNLFFKDVLSQIASLPGVKAVGATMSLPGHVGSSGPYYFDHLPERPDTTAPIAANVAVRSLVSPRTRRRSPNSSAGPPGAEHPDRSPDCAETTNHCATRSGNGRSSDCVWDRCGVHSLSLQLFQKLALDQEWGQA